MREFVDGMIRWMGYGALGGFALYLVYWAVLLVVFGLLAKAQR